MKVQTLGDLWNKMDFSLCQKIQKTVFPEGVLWDKAQNNYRTTTENEVFRLFRKVSSSYRKCETKKEDNFYKLSSLVAGEGLDALL